MRKTRLRSVSAKRQQALGPYARSTLAPSPKRVKPRNAKRAAKSFAKHFWSSERCEFVKALGCCIPHCGGGPIQNSHVRSRGAGGTYRDVVAHCVEHHREYEANKCVVANGRVYDRQWHELQAALTQAAWLLRDEGSALEQLPDNHLNNTTIQ